MKVYFLDINPVDSAHYHCLYTMRSAINTYTQLLSNVHHIHQGERRECTLSSSNYTEGKDKDTHLPSGYAIEGILPARAMSHPYTRWIGYSYDNYMWVLKSTIAMLNIYNSVYHKEHTHRATISSLLRPPEELLVGTGGKNKDTHLPPGFATFTLPPFATMPMEHRVKWMDETFPDATKVLTSFRAYYLAVIHKAIRERKYSVDYLGSAPDWLYLVQVESRKVTDKGRANVDYKDRNVHTYELRANALP